MTDTVSKLVMASKARSTHRSLWVEPSQGWGKKELPTISMIVAIKDPNKPEPTSSEIHDRWIDLNTDSSSGVHEKPHHPTSHPRART